MNPSVYLTVADTHGNEVYHYDNAPVPSVGDRIWVDGPGFGDCEVTRVNWYAKRTSFAARIEVKPL
jgi:hypothetical protein